MSLYGVALFHHKRAALSKVVREINEINLNMLRKGDSVNYRPQRNRIHLICIGLSVIGMTLGLTTSFSLFVEFLATGEEHLKNHLTAREPSYSLWPFLNCISNVILLCWMSSFLIFIFTLTFEFYLVIALHYRKMATGLKNICITTENMYETFKGFMADLHDLQRSVKITSILKEYHSVYNYLPYSVWWRRWTTYSGVFGQLL